MAAAQGLPVPGPRCAAGRRRACTQVARAWGQGPQVASLEAAGGGLLTRRSTRRAAPNSASSRSALSHVISLRCARSESDSESRRRSPRALRVDLPQHLRTSMPVGTSRAAGLALAAPVRRVSNDAVRDIRRSLLVAACTPDANYTRTLRPGPGSREQQGRQHQRLEDDQSGWSMCTSPTQRHMECFARVRRPAKRSRRAPLDSPQIVGVWPFAAARRAWC